MIFEELAEEIVEEIQTVPTSEADVLSKDFVPPPVQKKIFLLELIKRFILKKTLFH